MRSTHKKSIIIFASIILTIATLAVAFNTSLKLQYYTINSDKINQTVRIAVITDLHSCKYGKNESVLINAIESQSPDLVFLIGDIFDDKIPHDNSEALLKGIAHKYPCFYVTGNHEYWSNDINTILQLFKTYNVKILSGTYDTIEVNENKINICGITDPDATYFTDAVSCTEQLKNLENAHQNGYYTILLAHRPEDIENYCNYNFNLVLSGHAHGGQWRIPMLINGIYAPNQGLFPKYAGGKFNINGTNFIVSRGLAKESTRVPRIFNRPELVVIDIE